MPDADLKAGHCKLNYAIKWDSHCGAPPIRKSQVQVRNGSRHSDLLDGISIWRTFLRARTGGQRGKSYNVLKLRLKYSRCSRNRLTVDKNDRDVTVTWRVVMRGVAAMSAA